jgi:hypothetical protein
MFTDDEIVVTDAKPCFNPKTEIQCATDGRKYLTELKKKKKTEYLPTGLPGSSRNSECMSSEWKTSGLLPSAIVGKEALY